MYKQFQEAIIWTNASIFLDVKSYRYVASMSYALITLLFYLNTNLKGKWHDSLENFSDKRLSNKHKFLWIFWASQAQIDKAELKFTKPLDDGRY